MLRLLFLPFRILGGVLHMVFEILGGVLGMVGGIIGGVFGLIGGIFSLLLHLLAIGLIVGLLIAVFKKRSRPSADTAADEPFTSYYQKK